MEKQAMAKHKFIFILGTRPEVIKLSPLILELQKYSGEVCVINTGQQGELTEDFLKHFSINPTHSFILPSNRSLNLDLAKIITDIHSVLKNYDANNGVVFVQGDTSSALAGAVAGFNLGFTVAHIEAGLRTRDKKGPYPEETYRTIITNLADLHFAPTQIAQQNLITDGIKSNQITICGNTGIDSLVQTMKTVKQGNKDGQKYILVTLHRRENFGETIYKVTEMLAGLSKELPNSIIHFVTHTNPNVLDSYHIKFKESEKIIKLAPQSYIDFVELLSNSDLIITDSGGLQEESAFLGIPLIVVRDLTERSEVLSENCLLLSTNAITIKQAIINCFQNQEFIKQYKKSTTVFGDGKSAELIASKLKKMGMLRS
jgi:UDP-N-acetylglucosamine 2-epimerase (non-hydrolysing)